MPQDFRYSAGAMFSEVLFLLFIIMGAWLLFAGLRGRRIEGVVECAHCTFNLSGIDQHGLCPECGRSLSAPNGTRARRVRRWRIAVLGLLIIALGITPFAMLGLQKAAGIKLTENAPVWWLRTELRVVGAARHAEIVAELDVRLIGVKRTMTTAQAQAVTDDFSAMLADRNIAWNAGWSDFYERARLQSLVSDAQWMQYVERFLTISWVHADRVRTSEELPVQLEVGRALPVAATCPAGMIRILARLEAASIDGRAVAPRGSTEWMSAVGQVGGGSVTERMPISAPPGKARFIARYAFDVVTADGQERVVGSFVRDFESDIEVVGSDETLLRVISDDTLAGAIRSSLRVERLELRDDQVCLTIGVKQAPVDVGFQVLLRPRDGVSAGREFDLGTISCESGAGQQFFSNHRTRDEVGGLDATAVDIVLRSSLKAAEQSPTLRSVWIGPDIVLESPALMRPNTAP